MTSRNKLYYRAISDLGELVEGEFTDCTINEVSRRLTEAGLRPIFVGSEQIKASFLHKEIGRPKSALTVMDCKLFCETLEMMLRSGLRIDEAMLAANTIFTKNKRLSAFVRHLHHRLRLGDPLSKALMDRRFEFPIVTINLIKSGESSSEFPEILSACAIAFRRKIELRAAISSAAAYPAFVLIVAVVAISVLSLLVAPQLLTLFVSVDADVPATIALLATIGDFLRQQFLTLLVGILSLVVAVPVLLNLDIVRQQIQTAFFYLPIVGSSARWAAAGRFSTSLRLGRLAGMREEELARNAILASNCPSATTQAEVCIDTLRRGGSLSSWVKANHHFPKLLYQLLKTAEETGAYEASLNIVEAESERVLRDGIERISSMLAPGLILAIGLLIGTIVFSVFSSMNNLGSLLT